jgi:hypothetical protein
VYSVWGETTIDASQDGPRNSPYGPRNQTAPPSQCGPRNHAAPHLVALVERAEALVQALDLAVVEPAPAVLLHLLHVVLRQVQGGRRETRRGGSSQPAKRFIEALHKGNRQQMVLGVP